MPDVRLVHERYIGGAEDRDAGVRHGPAGIGVLSDVPHEPDLPVTRPAGLDAAVKTRAGIRSVRRRANVVSAIAGGEGADRPREQGDAHRVVGRAADLERIIAGPVMDGPVNRGPRVPRLVGQRDPVIILVDVVVGGNAAATAGEVVLLQAPHHATVAGAIQVRREVEPLAGHLHLVEVKVRPGGDAEGLRGVVVHAVSLGLECGFILVDDQADRVFVAGVLHVLQHPEHATGVIVEDGELIAAELAARRWGR